MTQKENESYDKLEEGVSLYTNAKAREKSKNDMAN